MCRFKSAILMSEVILAFRERKSNQNFWKQGADFRCYVSAAYVIINFSNMKPNVRIKHIDSQT